MLFLNSTTIALTHYSPFLRARVGNQSNNDEAYHRDGPRTQRLDRRVKKTFSQFVITFVRPLRTPLVKPTRQRHFRSNLIFQKKPISFSSLRLFVGESEEGYEGAIHELSLGGANLIYLTLKLLEFKYQREKLTIANFLDRGAGSAHPYTHSKPCSIALHIATRRSSTRLTPLTSLK
jgi:hypothetical protein